MREIVFDTETTGLSPKTHRLVEIGCVELINHVPTGKVYHQYINPEQPVEAAAERVHGLSYNFLKDYPKFAEIAPAFLEFVGDAKLVIHNASFDMGFINAELSRYEFAEIAYDRAIDTLQIARQLFPGSPASLDALCRRFEIDNSAREKHGALLDSELLAEVYLELLGGKQAAFGLDAANDTTQNQAEKPPEETVMRPVRPYKIATADHAAHTAMLDSFEAPIWQRYADNAVASE